MSGPDDAHQRSRLAKLDVRIAQDELLAARLRGGDLVALTARLREAQARREEARRFAREAHVASSTRPGELLGPVLPGLPTAIPLREALVAAGLLKDAPTPAPTPSSRAKPPAPERAPEVIQLLEEPPTPPSRVRRRGACGKLCWPSKAQARTANARARFRVRPYLCEVCRSWHVANQDKRRA